MVEALIDVIQMPDSQDSLAVADTQPIEGKSEPDLRRTMSYAAVRGY